VADKPSEHDDTATDIATEKALSGTS
jgi:hypothetical protein